MMMSRVQRVLLCLILVTTCHRFATGDGVYGIVGADAYVAAEVDAWCCCCWLRLMWARAFALTVALALELALCIDVDVGPDPYADADADENVCVRVDVCTRDDDDVYL